MSSISNFTQAVKELTGFDDSLTGSKEKAAPEESSVKTQNPEMPSFESEKKDARKAPEITMPSFAEGEGTFVTGTMVIDGDVTGSDQMKIDGRIKGNLTTTSAAFVNGRITGDVKAENLRISGEVKGDIEAGGNISVGETAVVVGNLTAVGASVKGRLKGDVKVETITEVTSCAAVLGNIDTGTLSTEGGSVIRGSITTRASENTDFDESVFNIGE